MPKSSHLQSHAFELVSRHGPRTVGMLVHSFNNLGNAIAGASITEQCNAAEKEILADARLVNVGKNPGFGGPWIGLKPDDKKV